MKQRRIKVAIAEKHTLIREGFCHIINGFSGFHIVFTASNEQELTAYLTPVKNRPDICLIDTHLPDDNGYEIVHRLKKTFPEVKMLMISVSDSPLVLVHALKQGADGLLLRQQDEHALLEALLALYNDTRYVPPMIERQIKRLRDTAPNLYDGLSKITENEIRFISYCCTEMPYAEIATAMGLRPRTAAGYKDSLYRKIGVSARTELARLGVQSGLSLTTCMAV